MIKEFDVAYIKSEMEKKQKQFLISIGALATATAAGHAPVDTGALRNSINYNVEGDYVKVGSNLIYANRREWEGRGSGYLAKTLDEMERSGIQQIAEKVFKW